MARTFAHYNGGNGSGRGTLCHMAEVMAGWCALRPGNHPQRQDIVGRYMILLRYSHNTLLGMSLNKPEVSNVVEHWFDDRGGLIRFEANHKTTEVVCRAAARSSLRVTLASFPILTVFFSALPSKMGVVYNADVAALISQEVLAFRKFRTLHGQSPHPQQFWLFQNSAVPKLHE